MVREVPPPPNQETINTVDLEFKAVETALAKLVPPTHESFRRFAQIAVKARQRLALMAKFVGLPNGDTEFQKGISELKELYVQAKEIMQQTTPERVARAVGLPSGAALESDLEQLVDNTLGSLPTEFGPLVRDVRKIAKNLAETPSKDTKGNGFYFRGSGEVNMDVLRKAQNTVAELAKLQSDPPKNVLPERLEAIGRLGKRLQAGLQQLEFTNPVRTASYQLYEALYVNRNKMDTKPLRILGTGLFGVVALFGVSMNVYQIAKGQEVNLSTTPGWLAAAVLFAHPEYIMSGAASKLQELIRLGDPKIIAAGQNFRGKPGVEALETLFAQFNKGGKTRQAINAAIQSSSLSAAQLGKLFGETGPLTQILSKIDEAKRPQTLATLFGLSKGQQKLLIDVAADTPV